MSEVIAPADDVSGRQLAIIFEDTRDVDLPCGQLDISVLRPLADYPPRSRRDGIQRVRDDISAVPRA